MLFRRQDNGYIGYHDQPSIYIVKLCPLPLARTL